VRVEVLFKDQRPACVTGILVEYETLPRHSFDFGNSYAPDTLETLWRLDLRDDEYLTGIEVWTHADDEPARHHKKKSRYCHMMIVR
jgi:hypothetical protein